MARVHRRRRSLSGVKVCKVVRGRIKCKTVKKSALHGMRRRRRSR